MFTAICYDIRDNTRRLRVAAVLKDYGSRIQRSVFEADVSDERFARLLKSVRRLVDPGEDSVRAYRMCASCRSRLVVVCGPDPYEEPPAMIVGPSGPTLSCQSQPEHRPSGRNRRSSGLLI